MKLGKKDLSRLVENVSYYGAFQLIFVVLVILLSSVGAFFHFLLDHEISIVESWLHNNQWELLIVSKVLSLFLLNRWFAMRLYQLKPIRVLIRELVSWPEFKALVVSVFMLLGILGIGSPQYTGQNLGYWYYQSTSYVGLVLFFGIEFVVIAYIEDVLNKTDRPPRLPLAVAYVLLFTIAFRISLPDYFGLLPYVVLCYSSLLYLSGPRFKSWSNVVCFLLIFVAPMGSLFGLDPVWGDDFSLFRIVKKMNLAFLAVLWMLSFAYYSYRDKFVGAARKLIR